MMKKNRRCLVRRMLAVLLCFCMLFTPGIAAGTENAGMSGQSFTAPETDSGGGEADITDLGAEAWSTEMETDAVESSSAEMEATAVSESASSEAETNFVEIEPDSVEGANGSAAPVSIEGEGSVAEGDTGTVEGDTGTVEGDTGTVEGTPGIVEGDTGTVEGTPGTVEGDPGSVEGDPGAVEGDPGFVEAVPTPEEEEATAGSTEEPSVCLLTEPAIYTAYDNGSADGAGAAVRFQVRLPENTGFFRADGTPADPAAEVFILRARQYRDCAKDNQITNYADNKSLIDAHMMRHAGKETTAGSLQFWRLWLEDESGAEIEVRLPAGASAEVTAEYLPGEDGTYSGALLGEPNELCTGVMDMGKPGEGVGSRDAFTETEQYSLTVSADPEKTQRTEDRYTKLTYYIEGNEDGSSPWGHVIAFAALQGDEDLDTLQEDEDSAALETDEDIAALQADSDVAAFSAAAVNADGIPQEILEQMAKENGIYPGTKTVENGQEIWTAYDGPSESEAAVKTTVTLPAETSAAEDHYLYIRKVEPGEPYYPTDEAVAKMAGKYNAYQCYAIHWVRVYQDNGEWKYEVQTDSVLGENVVANVKIEYQNPDAYLKGHKANRKLQVFNSRHSDGSELEEASTPIDVTANEDAYTGFTFTTNRGGPYVFVSQYAYEGYVASLSITQITDGAAPFDGDDQPGNDSGASNQIIRSYDMIEYDLTANFGARSNTSTAKSADMHYEMTIDADITEAVFNTNQMLWMGNAYSIEYLNESGEVVLTQNANGEYYTSGGQKINSPNDMASGSDQGLESYSTNITQQRLRGKITLTDSNNILAANHTFKAFVQVLGSDNGKIIQPTFRAWFEGNEDNYGSESPTEGDGVQLAQKVTANTVTADAVKVSAAARFNLELAKNKNVSHKGWFDSSTGKEINNSNTDSYTVGNTVVTGAQLYELLEALADLDENVGRSNPEEFTDNGNFCTGDLLGQDLGAYAQVFKNIRYGRITGYGISLGIYNDASENQNVASKGFKGISLPQGGITFDMELQSSVKVSAGKADPDQYYSQLWEYNENVNEEKGNQGKNMYWAFLDSTKYAAWAAPYNTGGNSESGCYAGGKWELGGEGYHFTIRDYDLNFLLSGLNFPTHRAGNSSATTGYNTYIGNFSAGYVQVLNVCPRHQSATLNMSTEIKVKNLAVTTTDGQSIATDPSDETGYAHETNTGDNALTDDIPLYAPGGMTKANAFGTAALFKDRKGNFASKDYFLGTDFWGTSYDCSAFAGQDITLVGAARIDAGDYQIRHMNMLQLFDSGALSIDETKDKPYVISNAGGRIEGTTTILYAADPDYPQGYNTNDKNVMTYMSKVREENLIYYESLDALRSAGYTCVGVMAELRNWTIYGEGGYSTALKIPMKVSQDEKYLGKTVGTVNTVRIWTNVSDMNGGKVSWKDGIYDFDNGVNHVDGYTPMEHSTETHYCGQVANGSPYEKTEYANGQVVLGSNTGGYVYGSSLLILSYKSEVDIEVDNGGDGALPTYDLDKGNYIVNYRLKDIIAKTDDDIGSAPKTQTDLTILSKLDIDRKDGGTEQRIAVAADSYHMTPASGQMVLTDEMGKPLETQSAAISSDPAAPTTVHYAFLDPATGKVDTTRIYTIQIYAQRDTNGNQVSFKVSGATIDVSLPDITYDAIIAPETVKDSNRILAGAYISGTSDVRAYSETAGNMDTVTIGIIQLTSTRLVKSVDKRYIELDGVYTYTVSYTNSGNEAVSFYLYDLLPDNDDIRDSDYDGEAILRDVTAELTGSDTFNAEIEFYYSKTAYTQLYNMVKVFGDENGRDKDKIEEMLRDTRWFQKLGTISSANDHEFQPSENLASMTKEALTQEMRETTGIYAVVKNLGGGRTLSISLSVEADGNQAGDLYRNIANSWLGDASTPLTSNMVETSVLAREISGVVWDDADFDGVRDGTEALVPGVTCTLFKWDDNKKKYVVCTEDVTGAEIQPVTTKEDGAYAFEKLGAGKYMVAFSGDGVKGTEDRPYVGATTYRTNGGDDSTTNDAVALAGTKGDMDTEVSGILGIDSQTYSYVIAYSLEAPNTVGGVLLHTIDEIVGGNISLTNDVELYANLDCGLVIASYKLPETGGFGTTPYTIGGVLIIGAGFLLLYRNKKRRKEDFASS